MNVFLKSIIKQFSAWKNRHVGNTGMLETTAFRLIYKWLDGEIYLMHITLYFILPFNKVNGTILFSMS